MTNDNGAPASSERTPRSAPVPRADSRTAALAAGYLIECTELARPLFNSRVFFTRAAWDHCTAGRPASDTSIIQLALQSLLTAVQGNLERSAILTAIAAGTPFDRVEFTVLGTSMCAVIEPDGDASIITVLVPFEP
ncbi:hypothetical protein LZC95_07790 [Pendulispora brunnea]|uniref:Uncharacterized protein n=1 Tax=Pendulispora brunnea TaxID=2905690 RepID=A0ABZ2KDF6_9BACT